MSDNKKQLIFPVEIRPVSGRSLIDLIKFAIKIAKTAQTYVTFTFNEKQKYFVGPDAKFDENDLDKFLVK